MLPRALFEFIAGSAEDGHTAMANRTAFEQVRYVPRALLETAHRSCAGTVLGESWSAPFGIAPMGAAAAFAHDADVVFARAAAAENVPFVLSGASLTPLERVLRENPKTWFQMYAAATKSSLSLVRRACEAGCQTLVLTVDVPVAGRRENDLRNGYGTPLRPSLKLAASLSSRPLWLLRHGLPWLRKGSPHFENLATGRMPMVARDAGQAFPRTSLTWDHVQRLRDAWSGTFVIKGLLSPEDAQRAFALGAQAVVMSNHGGRQLDGAVAPLTVLPATRSLAPSGTVLSDGGIRRGNDVIKSVACGADMVLVGRPMMYAAVVGGFDGVRQAIQLLREEILRSMTMLGIASLSEAKDRVHTAPGFCLETA